MNKNLVINFTIHYGNTNSKKNDKNRDFYFQEINGIKIPTKIEAIWRLEKGDFSKAKFNLRKIEYNTPENF